MNDAPAPKITAEAWAIAYENQGLIDRQIRRYGGLIHASRREDAWQCALIELARAVMIHDPEKGKLSTIASWYIRGALTRFVRTELAAERQISRNAFDRHQDGVRDEERPIESIAAPVIDETLSPDLERLHRALAMLPMRERQVIRRRADGDTLDSIACDLDLSRERVRQLEVKARAALKTTIERGRASIAFVRAPAPKPTPAIVVQPAPQQRVVERPAAVAPPTPPRVIAAAMTLVDLETLQERMQSTAHVSVVITEASAETPPAPETQQRVPERHVVAPPTPPRMIASATTLVEAPAAPDPSRPTSRAQVYTLPPGHMCPRCGADGEVTDSRKTQNMCRRRRRCSCGERWSTLEINVTQRYMPTDPTGPLFEAAW